MADSPKPSRPVSVAPDSARLHDLALAHLARYAATETGLLRVLLRAIDRWARGAVAAGGDEDQASAAAALSRVAAQEVVRRLAAAGAVDDAAFAATRAARLQRTGHSRRAVGAHLAARGVAAEIARATLPEDPEAELGAALLLARRRRIGPFRLAPADPVGRVREIGILARAGFAQDVARRTLAMSPEEAEALVLRLRRP
jgi:regulatory protein